MSEKTKIQCDFLKEDWLSLPTDSGKPQRRWSPSTKQVIETDENYDWFVIGTANTIAEAQAFQA